MYALRAALATLSILAITYVGLSLLVAMGWRWAVRLLPQRSSNSSAKFLYWLRISPVLGSMVAALCFELPSFLSFEPKVVEEQLGALPVALSVLCLVFTVVVAWRALAAWRQTAAVCRRWTNGLPAVQERQGMPVFSTNAFAPPMAVVGIRSPRLLLSPNLLNVLERGELDRALAHEASHVRHWDNLRKLTLLLCRFPGMAALEREWADAAEFAADESAVHNRREALDLASALVKISGMALPAAEPQALVTNFVGSSASTARRVQSLTTWRKRESAESSRWKGLAALVGAAFALSFTYTAILSNLHSLTELLFR